MTALRIAQYTEVSLRGNIAPFKCAVRVKGKWVSAFAAGAVRVRREQGLAWLMLSRREDDIVRMAAERVARSAYGQDCVAATERARKGEG